MKYCNSDFKRLNTMNLSALCTTLYNFRYRNHRVHAVNNSTFFGKYSKNWHITPNISECPGPILTYFIGLIGVLAGMIIQIWQPVTIPQGTLPCNQLKSKNRRFSRTNLIYRTALLKWTAISQFRFQKIK